MEQQTVWNLGSNLGSDRTRVKPWTVYIRCFRRLRKSAKFSEQITTNNNLLFFVFIEDLLNYQRFIKALWQQLKEWRDFEC